MILYRRYIAYKEIMFMSNPKKVLKKIKKVEHIVDKALEKASTNTDIDTQKRVRVSKKIQKINDEIIKDIDNIMKNNLT